LRWPYAAPTLIDEIHVIPLQSFLKVDARVEIDFCTSPGNIQSAAHRHASVAFGELNSGVRHQLCHDFGGLLNRAPATSRDVKGLARRFLV
jgi:hypothetical protein